MSSVGFATLDVIPSLKGTRASLEKQVAGDFAAVGKSGGKKLGDAAGASAATSFGKAKGRFLSEAKAMAAPLAGIFAGAAVVNFFGDSLAEARDAAKTARVTAQVIKTTGGAANLTAKQVSDLSGRMMDYAAVDDDVVQAGANVLLTFKNVRDEIGAGNDIFSRATKAGLDLQAVLGGDLTGSAKLLGKALNDPVKGITALTRAGVQFTADQQEQIKGLVAQNDLLSAQKIVLAEVEGQVGGTAGAAVDSTQRMSVAFGELKESVGTAALPAVEGFSTFMVDKGIPALAATGGAVSDAVKFFNALPAPVKVATAALAGLKIASALGVGTSLSAGAAKVGSALDTVRLKAMLAADEYRSLRKASIQAEQQGFRFNQGSGRIVSGLGAVRSAAKGAGTALKSGLGGALGLVGGPWGAAFIAGTTILTHFWQENQKSKQRVDALTDSLNEQTGAITKKTKAQVFDALQESGMIDLANQLGVSLTDVRDAALGSTDAQERLAAQFDVGAQAIADNADAGSSASKAAADYRAKADLLTNAVGGQNSEVRESIQNWKDQATFLGKSEAATDGAKVAIRDYSKELIEARKQIHLLMNAEQERVDNAVRQRRDQLALITTLNDARKEARKGKQTLDENTAAGRKNLGQLLDLADQWNNSSPKVQNARGAYRHLRDEFIKLADQMNGPQGTRKDAEKLADQLLKVPKHVAVEFQSKGFKERMHEIAALKLAAQGITSTVDFDPLRPDHPTHTPPSGGGGGKGGGGTSGRVISVNNTYNVNTIGDAQKFDLHKRQQAGMGGFG